MMANGHKIKERGMEILPGLTKTITLECGKTIKNKDKALTSEKTVIIMLVSGWKIELKVMEPLLGNKLNMLVSGVRTNVMVKVPMRMKKEFILVDGKQIRNLAMVK